jgi:hypothetical protein
MAHAIMHVDGNANLWYIKIGTPSNRAGLVINLPVIGEIGSVGAYLQLGKDLDAMPDIPDEIAAITGAPGSAGLSSLMETSKRAGASGGRSKEIPRRRGQLQEESGSESWF